MIFMTYLLLYFMQISGGLAGLMHRAYKGGVVITTI